MLASRFLLLHTTPYTLSAPTMQYLQNTADNATGLNAKNRADLEFCGEMYLPLDTMKQDV